MSIAHILCDRDPAISRVISDLCAVLRERNHRCVVLDAISLESADGARPEGALERLQGHLADAIDLARNRGFDVLHVHADHPVVAAAAHRRGATLSTLRCRIDRPHAAAASRALAGLPCIATSEHQVVRAPWVRWLGLVHDGVAWNRVPFCQTVGTYLAFGGATCRLDRVVAMAERSGLPLRIATPAGDPWSKRRIDTLANGHDSIQVQEVASHGEWIGLVQNALALVISGPAVRPPHVPIVEAMACGTPIVAFADGHVAEMLRPGVSGFIVDSVEDAIDVLDDVVVLDRRGCRVEYARRFTAERMADEYLSIYGRLATHPAAMSA
jgi:prepilin-type processing-associated H-X9-DG protein